MGMRRDAHIIIHQELQTQMTLSSPLSSARRAGIKDKKKQVSARMWRKVPLEHRWWERSWWPLSRIGWRRLRKLKIEILYDPASGVEAKGTQTGYGGVTGTPTFMVVSVQQLTRGKQPKCPPRDEGPQKMWCQQEPAISKSQIVPLAVTRMSLGAPPWTK